MFRSPNPRQSSMKSLFVRIYLPYLVLHETFHETSVHFRRRSDAINTNFSPKTKSVNFSFQMYRILPMHVLAHRFGSRKFGHQFLFREIDITAAATNMCSIQKILAEHFCSLMPDKEEEQNNIFYTQIVFSPTNECSHF